MEYKDDLLDSMDAETESAEIIVENPSDKVSRAKHRVSVRRRVEDILTRKVYKEKYGDLFLDEDFAWED
ncbi:MAG: hypothetical protein CMF50_01090 [Legionellales bacterium]|mgnify:CR=1 FL=1|nr:hypothetical protein [Legionellales bacterium]|tara:strand:- start:5967 stop:6173 length:207 start_codon:yes stop_codon:yes gene_type:complete